MKGKACAENNQKHPIQFERMWFNFNCSFVRAQVELQRLSSRQDDDKDGLTNKAEMIPKILLGWYFFRKAWNINNFEIWKYFPMGTFANRNGIQMTLQVVN